jgi:hypothetical protein
MMLVSPKPPDQTKPNQAHTTREERPTILPSFCIPSLTKTPSTAGRKKEKEKEKRLRQQQQRVRAGATSQTDDFLLLHLPKGRKKRNRTTEKKGGTSQGAQDDSRKIRQDKRKIAFRFSGIDAHTDRKVEGGMKKTPHCHIKWKNKRKNKGQGTNEKIPPARLTKGSIVEESRCCCKRPSWGAIYGFL